MAELAIQKQNNDIFRRIEEIAETFISLIDDPRPMIFIAGETIKKVQLLTEMDPNTSRAIEQGIFTVCHLLSLIGELQDIEKTKPSISSNRKDRLIEAINRLVATRRGSQNYLALSFMEWLDIYNGSPKSDAESINVPEVVDFQNAFLLEDRFDQCSSFELTLSVEAKKEAVRAWKNTSPGNKGKQSKWTVIRRVLAGACIDITESALKKLWYSSRNRLHPK